MSKFPRTIAAVQKRDRSLWEIGDALLAECGKPSEHGVNDGSYAKLGQAAAEIEALKIADYSVKTLSRLRYIAFTFPRTSRKEVLSWQAHEVAGSPEMLDAVVKVSGKQKVAVQVVRETRKAIEIEDERKEQQKRRADPEYKTPPQRRVTPPTPKEATGLAFLAESLRQGVVVSRCTRDMESVAEWLEKNLHKLESVEIDDLVDSCLSLAETARQVADAARKLRTNRRSHLALVKGD